jgi:Rad3-related DNA helicase
MELMEGLDPEEARAIVDPASAFEDAAQEHLSGEVIWIVSPSLNDLSSDITFT